MKNLIFYFTGTGNSLQVSNDLADILGDCSVINIAKFNFSNEITAERIGFVFPVYFWGIPLIFERFLKQVQIKGNAYLFAVATFGLWPGKALEIAQDILEQRGLKLNTGFFIKMPDNYILWYGAKSKAVQDKCFQQESEKIKVIGKSILLKQNNMIEKSRYMIDRLLTYPVNKFYKKRFAAVSKYFSAQENCIGCGLCIKNCPVKNIELKENRPVWGEHCEACLACIQRCPMQAINYKNKTQRRKRYINPNVHL